MKDSSKQLLFQPARVKQLKNNFLEGFTCMIGESKVSESLQFLIKNIGMLSNSGLNGGSNDTVVDYVLWITLITCVSYPSKVCNINTLINR